MTDVKEGVECAECGHHLERHSRAGCDFCSCAARWTVREVGEVRRRAGLPVRFRREDY